MAFKDTYSIDASLAERALKSLTRAQEKISQETDKSVEKLSKQERAARRLNEQAEPTLRYARRMEDLAKAVDLGGVKMDNAQTLAVKYTQQLDRAQGAGNRAFGSQSINQLSQYAGQLATVAGGVAGIRALFSQVNEVADEAAGRIRASLDAVGQLQQLGDTADTQAFAKQLRQAGVFTDKAQASDFAFSVKAAGIQGGDRDFLAELLAERFIKPGQAVPTAQAAKKTQRLLGISDFEVTLQKLTAASGPTSATIPQIADAVTKFGGNFTTLNYSPDAALAAIQVAEAGSSNPATAAERLKSFTDQMRKRDLSRGSFRATVDSIRSRIAAGENAFDILGESNAVKGFELFDSVSERKDFDLAVKAIAAAPAEDVIGKRLTLRNDPQFAAAVEAEKAEGALQVAAENRFATPRNLFRTIRARSKTAAIQEGSYATIGMEYTGSAALSNALYYGLGPENYFAMELGLDEPGDAGRLSAETEAQMIAYIMRSALANERSAVANERAASALEGSTNPSEE